MKTIIFYTLLLMAAALAVNAQKNDCPELRRMIDRAKELSDSGKYDNAIKKLRAARAYCPAAQKEIDAHTDAVFIAIQKEKERADKAKEQAIAAEKRANQALENTKKMIKAFLPDSVKYVYTYFRSKAQHLYIIGEYTQAKQMFTFANYAYDKPAHINLNDKVEQTSRLSKIKEQADSLFKIEKYTTAQPMYETLVNNNTKDSVNRRMLSITDPMCDLVFVPGGTFYMGSDSTDTDAGSDEKPMHKVTLSSFEITRYEITNAQYAKFLNEYGSDKVKTGEFAGKTMIYEYGWGVKKENNQWVPQTGYENHPVVRVTWFGANEFCKYYGGRLPTEAQWEYAATYCTKNTKNKYAGTNNPDSLEHYAWYDKNSGSATHAVGKKLPNALGLYDMSGNVWEWCADWYSSNYYQTSPEKNPKGAKTGNYRVLRGGSWDDDASDSRSTDRNFNDNDLGFRLVFP